MERLTTGFLVFADRLTISQQRRPASMGRQNNASEQQVSIEQQSLTSDMLTYQLNQSGRSSVDPLHPAANAGAGMSLWFELGHRLRRDTALLGHDMATIVSRWMSVSLHLVFVGRIG
ncbi:hypothetical protein EVAR_69326_1 [Eumeta japonica]|uniref:Uncharacterized protein n=1 Tax=Eumeta variegata TaxID=151549 RepID=A0A4C2A085_EUMVA|nr:hypothetical protein EVAR_69326_1 [Eumeta japonica]